jgi:hypothetical protein
MSMILSLVTLSDTNIARLLADPPLVWQVIAPDDPELYEAARATRKSNFLSRLFGQAPASSTAQPLDLTSFEGGSVDLDKAWHGIHYLLTHTAWDGERPLNFLVGGGTPIGDIDVGYGPARAFRAIDVREAHGAIELLSNDVLMGRFDPSAMITKEIYPEIWQDSGEDDSSEYLVEYVDTLRGFLRETAHANLGMVVYLA